MTELIKTDLGTLSAVGIGLQRAGQVGSHTATATVVGSGSVSATVLIKGSNDGLSWSTAATLTAIGTGTGSASAKWTDDYALIRKEVTSLTGAAVSTQVVTDQSGGGGQVVVAGGGAGPRKRRLARAVHYGRQNTFDPSNYEILQQPVAWTAAGRFCAGTPMRNPAYPDYFFVFRGIQLTTGNSDFDTSFTTIPAPVPNTSNAYAVIRDNASRAVWFQYPASKFSVTKRASLMQADGVTPIVPVLTRAYEFNGAPVDAKGIAMREHYYYTWTRADYATNAAALAVNRAKLDSIRYTPGRKAIEPNYGGTGNYYLGFDASGNRANTTLSFEWVFDCTASALCIALYGAPSVATNGDVLYGANIVVDGVAVDFETMRWPAAGQANDQRPGRFTLNFRDARRRRVRVTFAVPMAGAPCAIESLWCSDDGVITAPNGLITPWEGEGDSTWSGAGPGPFNGFTSNKGFSIGSALGFGGGVDLGQGGTGHIHPPDAPSKQMCFTSRFKNNLDNGLSAINGGEDMLMHVVDISGWDEVTTNAAYTVDYRRAKYTEFLNLWKVNQPNCVLVFIFKRFDPDIEEMNFMDLSSAAGLAVGDTIGNAASNPTTKGIVQSIVGNRVFYVTAQFPVSASSSAGDPSRWVSATRSGGFQAGQTVFKGTTNIGSVNSAPANRVSRIDSTGRSINVPSVLRPEEDVVFNDWVAAIQAAQLESDQYMFISLGNMPKDEINNFSTDYAFVGQGFGDPNNPAVGVDSVHNIVAYHNLVGKYVANQIRLAVSAYY